MLEKTGIKRVASVATTWGGIERQETKRTKSQVCLKKYLRELEELGEGTILRDNS